MASFLTLFAWWVVAVDTAGPAAPARLAEDYTNRVQPLLKQYCLKCHSQKAKKGDLDLDRFASIEHARKDVRAWQLVVEMLENGEMPPKKETQLRPDERQRLVTWSRRFLEAEAQARAGDPGRVVVRRLSNAEYNNTIRDLTGVDLQPARDFPIDGAAGEGFTNAGDALATSPTLLNKYLNAAKEVAGHAVLLPDGFRFSPSKTRRDWTDEVLADLHRFYAAYTADGSLPLGPILAAAIRQRDELTAGKITPREAARGTGSTRSISRSCGRALTGKEASFPLDQVRARWRQAKPQDAGAILADIAAWQKALWQIVPIGSYRYGNVIRQVPNNAVIAETQPLRFKLKPAPGQTEVVLYLTAREFAPAHDGALMLWHRPRFEGGNKPPLLLRDVAQVADAVRGGLSRALRRHTPLSRRRRGGGE